MNIAENNYDHNEHVINLPGEFGYSPCDLWSSPGETDYPQSVGIFMDRRPTDEEIEILKERAKKFQSLEDNKEKIKVLGFRLFLRKTVQTEIPL